MHSRASGEAARRAKRGRQPLPSRAISPARGHVRISCFARRTTEKRETARSLPHAGFTSLAAKQVSLGPVKHKTCTDFVAKSRTTLYFLQPTATWFVARQSNSWEIKRATSLFNSCKNFAKQVARFCSLPRRRSEEFVTRSWPVHGTLTSF